MSRPFAGQALAFQPSFAFAFFQDGQDVPQVSLAGGDQARADRIHIEKLVHPGTQVTHCWKGLAVVTEADIS